MDFQFNNKEYLHKERVATGSKLGRNFACSYIRLLDRELMNYEKAPLFYKMFIDGFGFWVHGEDELIKFKNFANGIHKIETELH